MHFSLFTLLDDDVQQALHDLKYLTYCVKEWTVGVGEKVQCRQYQGTGKTVYLGRSNK
jgi:hypothetical protein